MIPNSQHRLIVGDKIDPVWLRFLQSLDGKANASDIADIATALGSPDGTVANIPDLSASTVRILQGAGIAVTRGEGGEYYIALRPLGDSGAGTFKLITRDTAGRISGSKDGTAADVPYDPTASGLTATDTQAAIDELQAEKLDDAPSDGSTYGRKDGAWAIVPSGGGSSGTPPESADFTTFGAGITVADKTDRMQLVVTSVASALRGLVQNSIATPYTIDAHLCHAGACSTTDESGAGLCLSDGTKYVQFTVGYIAGALGARVITWATSNSGAAVLHSSNVVAVPSDLYIRLTDDGTTRKYLVSGNGLDYLLLFSHATNTHLTPTKVGLCVYNKAAGTLDSKTAITNWVVTASVLGDAA